MEKPALVTIVLFFFCQSPRLLRLLCVLGFRTVNTVNSAMDFYSPDKHRQCTVSLGYPVLFTQKVLPLSCDLDLGTVHISRIRYTNVPQPLAHFYQYAVYFHRLGTF